MGDSAHLFFLPGNKTSRERLTCLGVHAHLTLTLCSTRLPQMKHAITTSYTPPLDASGAVALLALDQWLEAGLKLEEGKYGLGFPFMYLLLTGSLGLKVPAQIAAVSSSLLSLSVCFSS